MFFQILKREWTISHDGYCLRCPFKEHHAIIEAGTGVGKSLAYLLPAVITAVTKNKPIIISTYTTQLQEQLLHNDIPLLKKVIQYLLKQS